MKKTTLSLIVSMAAVSACGGGDSGPEVIGGATLPSGPTQFVADLRDALEIQNDLFNAYDDGLVRPTGSTTLNYNGHMSISNDSGTGPYDGYLGQASATFDPSSSALNGSATNFHSSVITPTTGGGIVIGNGTPVSGTVTFSGTGFTVFDTVDTTFSGTLDGQAIAGNGDAEFYGANGTLLDIIAFNGTMGGEPVDISVSAD